MLHVADRAIDLDMDVPPAMADAPLTLRRVEPGSATSASRYGERKSPNWLAIGLILLVHTLLIAAIMHVRQQAHRREETRLSVVNLTPPPPPPEEEAPPPPPSQPQIVAPPPVVQVPVPPVQIATTPEAQPPARITSAAISVVQSSAPIAVSAPPSIVQGGDLSAQMLAGKPPRYPVESRRKREQGTVVLALTLGLDGAVETIAIAHSSGFSRLDDAARDAVRRWRWKPMLQQGQPVRVKGVVEIPFILQTAST